MMQYAKARSSRGVASVLAMLFLVMLAILSAAMYAVSTLNQRVAYNYIGVDRARLAAETGMDWIAYRLRAMPKPVSKVASLGGTFAYDTLWSDFTDPDGTSVKGLSTCIVNDLKNVAGVTVTLNGHTITTSDIPLDSVANGSRFGLEIAQDPIQGQKLYVIVTGKYGGNASSGGVGAVKSVQMEFWVDKQIRYAVVGKVPIQIGKNVLVEGDVAMTLSNYKNQPAILSLSDFKYVPNQWNTFQAFQDFLAGIHSNASYNYNDYSNRIDVGNRPDLAKLANQAGYTDVNGDGFIDEYDLFLTQVSHSSSANGPQISRSQYLSDPNYGQDPAMFKAIDNLHALYSQSVKYDPTAANDYVCADTARRPGFGDGYINNLDQYAKVYGQLTIYDANGLNGSLLQGPIINPGNGPAVQIGFNQEDNSVYSGIQPSSFAACSDRLLSYSGGNDGSSAVRQAGVISNTTLQLADQQYSSNTGRPMGDYELVQVSNAGNTTYQVGQAVTIAALNTTNARLKTGQQPATYTSSVNYSVERTPWGSSSYQAIYKRPVFRNVHFTNVTIPMGMNPVFLNCTFDGVTFVKTQAVTGAANSSDAWNWVQTRTDVAGTANLASQVCLPSRSLTGSPASMNLNTQIRTKGSEQGNNVRFDSCTFNGPVAGNNADVYTHCANSWEFTGNSVLQNSWKDPAVANSNESVAICSPQANIEMGGYQAGKINTINLKGVIVAGNYDVRGQGYIDGQIIVTGDGAGNTTLGYFGESDGATSVSPADVGKSGCLIIHYNPTRGLPYGISVPVTIVPDRATYREFLQ